MNPLLHIRKNVFAASQAEMARIAGVWQGTWSKYERGEFAPGGDALERIRNEAIRRKLDWNDRWFFEAPSSEVTEAAE